MARDLRLHKVDEYDGSAGKDPNVRSLIDREVKRRVFWYIASEDWLQSTISGPQEGTYWIQYSHIKVNLPQDCTDDDLACGESCRNITSNEPTYMTAFLERIRLSHICREITDTIPLDTTSLLQMPYERIIALDQTLENYLATLPRFLQCDFSDGKILESIYPQLPAWRYCVTKAAHSRRWKLNQRFLLRQNLDPRHSHSRRACVMSARAVINGYADLVAHNSPSTLLTRMGMAVHFTHLALGILIMDLCFNRNEADEAQIKEDVRVAFKIFEDAKAVSPLLERSLASLKDVLHRNRINLTDESGSEAYRRDETVYSRAQSASEATEPEGLSVTDTTFDTFWDIALQSSSEMDFGAWDNLFSTLDTRPI
ncbi:hypothetical protein N0V90_001318 [Kalmusia sp. IMI 367209]|nr:hypothetical protein N0V90_001318 [Kalmusia sp. IMI 367209]